MPYTEVSLIGRSWIKRMPAKPVKSQHSALLTQPQLQSPTSADAQVDELLDVRKFPAPQAGLRPKAKDGHSHRCTPPEGLAP